MIFINRQQTEPLTTLSLFRLYPVVYFFYYFFFLIPPIFVIHPPLPQHTQRYTSVSHIFLVVPPCPCHIVTERAPWGDLNV